MRSARTPRRSRRGRRVGLYHFGLNVGESDDDLREALANVQEAGATVVGASDHTVTHSLYILDPDGNEIELYVDVPGVDWQVGAGARRRPDPPPRALSARTRAGRPPDRWTAHEDRVRADADGARAAAEVLAGGGVAVVPTDTVYGLAARPGDADAVRAVFRAKGRPEGMHLPVLAASLAQVRALGVAFTPAAEALARWWWPGPLTLAFGFADGASPARAGWPGREEVAVRIPDHDFLRALLEQTGVARGDQRQPARRADAAHGARTWRPASGPPSTCSSTAAGSGTCPPRWSTCVRAEAVVEREGAISRAEMAGALADAP